MRNDFDREASRDPDLAETVVEEALLAGAVEAEVYLKTSATLGIFLNQRFASLTGGMERGIALRVFDGEGNFGHAYSSWVDGGRNREMIRSALTSLQQVAGAGRPREPLFPSPRPAEACPDPEGIRDPRVEEWPPEAKRRMLEAALREASWGHAEGTAAAYRDGISRISLANSRGFKATYARTLSVATLTRSGQRSPTLHAERVASGPDPDGVMELAARLAQLQPGSGEEELEPGDLLLEPSAAESLLGRLARELEEDGPGSGVGPGAPSFQRFASEVVTVVDDGRLPGGVASAPFDGEGVPTGRLTLLKAGVRIDRLRRPGTGENGRAGSAVRASYRDLPAPGATNLFIVPGNRSVPEILSGIRRGFQLAVLESDARRERPETGDTRWRGIGWEVRDGAVVGPCRKILFRAESRAMLGGILEVSDRLRFSFRRGVALGSPDLFIRWRG